MISFRVDHLLIIYVIPHLLEVHSTEKSFDLIQCSIHSSKSSTRRPERKNNIDHFLHTHLLTYLTTSRFV